MGTPNTLQIILAVALSIKEYDLQYEQKQLVKYYEMRQHM
jgi:hypothetical protein